MEPITNTSHAVLRTAVRLELLDAEGGSHAVPATLTYDRTDPYAVSLMIGEEEGLSNWSFARDLLSDGLYEPSGDGDVHVWPCLGDGGRAIVLIELSTADEEALLQTDPRELLDFLTLSYTVVAPGEESDYLDVNAAIEALLEATPPRP